MMAINVRLIRGVFDSLYDMLSSCSRSKEGSLDWCNGSQNETGTDWIKFVSRRFYLLHFQRHSLC